MPTIVSQLPVVFENGMRWSAIACRCYLCDHELPDTKVRGTISRAFPRVAVLDAVGVCEACKLLTGFAWRLHDDRRITGMTNQGWTTWAAQSSTWDRALHIARSLLKSVFSLERRP